jgi:hypothetical protein
VFAVIVLYCTRVFIILPANNSGKIVEKEGEKNL